MPDKKNRTSALLLSWRQIIPTFVTLLAMLSGFLSRDDRLMIAVIAAVFIAHFFYYFSGGPDFGARYWFLMLIPLGALTARGISALKEKLDSGEKMFLLDVRSKEEFEEKRMKDVSNIYVGHLEERVKEIPKGNPIVTICETGNRASLAASILLKNEHDNVYNLLGGMSSWSESKYPTTK